MTPSEAVLAVPRSAIVTCPVCNGTDAPCFFASEPLPVVVNAVCRERAAAVDMPRMPVELHCCGACGVVFNARYDAAHLALDQQYDNTQSHSRTFSATVDAAVDHLVRNRGVVGRTIIEVGCGGGVFLRALVERGAGNRGLGFDPAYTGTPVDLDGRLRFERRNFGPGMGEVRGDVGLVRHVLGYAPDPVAMMGLLREALAGSDDGRVFVEAGCVEWSLRHGMLLDFFYEYHCHFAAASLATALGRAGFRIEASDHDFEGQYVRIEARRAEQVAPDAPDPGAAPALAARCGAAVATIRAAWRRQVERLAVSGPVALWGAAGKGAMFANLVDPSATRLACVVDLNPNKQGCFLPGTGHAIVAPETLAAQRVAAVVVANPNYLDEVRDHLAALGGAVDVEPVEMVDGSERRRPAIVAAGAPA